MSVNLTINGITYTYPTKGETNWGVQATAWAQAVTSGMLQKAGGSFPLLAEVDFGATYGLKTAYIKSQTPDAASTGQIRLAHTDSIAFRNDSDTADLLLSVNGANQLIFDGDFVGTITSLTGHVTGSGFGAVNTTISSNVITNDMVNSSAAIAYSKLNLTNSVTNADLAGSIAYSKLVLTNSVTNADLAGSIAYSKLNLTNSVTNADLAGSIAYSKLVLTNSVTNADLAGSIAYSKLVLTNSVTNADLAGSINRTKLVPLTASRVMVTDGSGNDSASSVTTTTLGYLDATSSIQTQLNAKLEISSFTDTAVTSKLITGYSSGAGTVAATDTILQAINKLNGNDGLNLKIANNLSDLTNTTTARANLGLGTLATQSGTFSGTSSGINTGDQTITLTGDVTGSGTGSFAATVASVGGQTAAAVAGAVSVANAALPSASFTDTAVTSKLITGFVSGAGTVAATDTILQAINKLNGNDGLNLKISNNLSDLNNVTAARANLGLGTLATQSGTFSGTSSGTNTGDQTITLTGDVTGSGTGSFAATIANNAVTDAKIRQSVGVSLVGRSANSTGNVADIVAAANNTVLKRDSNALSFGTIVNADVDAAAAIAGTKVDPNFGSQNIVTTGSISGSGATLSGLSVAGVVHNNASGVLSTSLVVNADVDAAAAIAGTKISPNFGSQNVTTTGSLSGSGATLSGLSVAGIVHNNASGVLSTSLIVNADVDASAAISLSKLATVTASKALVSDVSGNISASTTTATEIGYVSGVTSSIQTQLDSKITNPMTTGGDIVYGGASGAPTRLANGSAGQVLMSSGGTAAPQWTDVYKTSALAGNTTAVSGTTYLVDTAAARTITLPAAATNAYFRIKDVKGTCSTNNITIARAGSEKIEGVAANKVLSTNWGSWTFLSDGTDWFMV